MGKRKAARDEAVGRASAVVSVLLVDDVDGLVAASLLVAAGATDDRYLWVVVLLREVCGRRSTSARRRNILIGAIVQ